MGYQATRRMQVGLYVLGIATNMTALAILLQGLLLQHFSTREKVVAALVSALSAFFWGLYFIDRRRL